MLYFAVSIDYKLERCAVQKGEHVSMHSINIFIDKHRGSKPEEESVSVTKIHLHRPDLSLEPLNNHEPPKHLLIYEDLFIDCDSFILLDDHQYVRSV